MLLSRLVSTSRLVTSASGRLEKVALLADLLREAGSDEVEILAAYLSGAIRQTRLGVGYAGLRSARAAAAAASASDLTLGEVDTALDRIASVTGKGSEGERQRQLRALWERATAEEQEFLGRLVLGELRQGALEGIVLEAIARAGRIPPEQVRRAFMTTGDLPTVARAALTEGAAGLSQFAIQLFRPILPMLAETAQDVGDALSRLGTAALEYKLDGARVQVHKAGDEVRIYSRRLNEVTAAVPEVVETVRALPARELILDGEAIALRGDGSPLPFQTTMRRFGRRLEVDRLRRELPLSPLFFDLLYLDGEPLLDRPQAERFALLGKVAPGLVVPGIVTARVEEAEAFLAGALAHGHEGVMAKAVDAPYQAGHRGQRWLKLKAVRTLDLVVLAAEWGSGRRQGWLSNLHLGARDPDAGGFVMLGKTFKGMTDELLAWQTEQLLARETTRDGHIVYVRPELVVEVAFNDVQTSSQYPGGVALRFARIKGYRHDKAAAEADTIESVREIHRQAGGERE